MRRCGLIKTILLAVAAGALYGLNTVVLATDQIDCLLCHKYRGLSRVNDEGDFRLYYINAELFESGPHRRNDCRDCHTDIDRIPHKPAEKVNCTQLCHIVEPSGNNYFSHKSVAENLSKSAHGKLDADGKPKRYQEDYPDCKDCHDQPLYRPISVYKGVLKHGLSKRSMSRCKSCHKTGDFSQDFYEHVTSRLHKTRLSLEIVEVCAKCHEDPEFRKRHELDDVITTYKQTFHGKLLALGSERAADCLDCHVVEGENNHLIESRTVATSSTHASNVGRTCMASDCHERASESLSSFQTHVTYEREKYPIQFYMLVFFKALMAVVLYFFLALIFFELLRRLFPKFSFLDDNIPHHTGIKPEVELQDKEDSHDGKI